MVCCLVVLLSSAWPKHSSVIACIWEPNQWSWTTFSYLNTGDSDRLLILAGDWKVARGEAELATFRLSGDGVDTAVLAVSWMSVCVGKSRHQGVGLVADSLLVAAVLYWLYSSSSSTFSSLRVTGAAPCWTSMRHVSTMEVTVTTKNVAGASAAKALRLRDEVDKGQEKDGGAKVELHVEAGYLVWTILGGSLRLASYLSSPLWHTEICFSWHTQ